MNNAFARLLPPLPPSLWLVVLLALPLFGDGFLLIPNREIRYTFTDTGIKQIILTQTVVSTGEQYRLDSFVVVKVRGDGRVPDEGRLRRYKIR